MTPTSGPIRLSTVPLLPKSISGVKPQHLDVADPPRALAGHGPASLPLRLAFLDEERRIPILIRQA